MIKAVDSRNRGVSEVGSGFSQTDAISMVIDYFERCSPEARTAIMLYQRVMGATNELGNKILEAVVASLDADKMKDGDDTDGKFVLGLLHGMRISEDG